MKNILIAEDDKDIVELLTLYLESNNYQVFKSYNGKEAWDIFNKNKIDLVLADIMMDEVDGYELLKKIRTISDVPFIIVSAKAQDNDKILGLNLGADVYITKPFNPLEVLAYIKTIFRRSSTDKIIIFHDLKLDLESYKAYKKGVDLNLTSSEIKMLAMMMKNVGKIFTKNELYSCLGNSYCYDDNTVMVHISNIRSKIEDDPSNPKYIVTVRGLGYKFLENYYE